MDRCWSTTPPPHAREHVPVVDQEFKTQFCRGHDLRRRRRLQAHEPGRLIIEDQDAKTTRHTQKYFLMAHRRGKCIKRWQKSKWRPKSCLELLNTGLYHVLFCKLRYHCCQIVVRWINHVKYCFRFPQLWRKMLTPLFGETGMSRFFFFFFFFFGGGGGGGGGMHWHPVTSLLEL